MHGRVVTYLGDAILNLLKNKLRSAHGNMIENLKIQFEVNLIN